MGRRSDGNVHRTVPVVIEVDGVPVTAYEGESLAAALLAAGWRAFGRRSDGSLRGPYCNMGVCFECILTVDGRPGVRACTTPVRASVRVETGTNGVRAGDRAADGSRL